MHTHTLFNVYGLVKDNIKVAEQVGLMSVALTGHGPAALTAGVWRAGTLLDIVRSIEHIKHDFAIEVFSGVEASIVGRLTYRGMFKGNGHSRPGVSSMFPGSAGSREESRGCLHNWVHRQPSHRCDTSSGVGYGAEGKKWHAQADIMMLLWGLMRVISHLMSVFIRLVPMRELSSEAVTRLICRHEYKQQSAFARALDVGIFPGKVADVAGARVPQRR